MIVLTNIYPKKREQWCFVANSKVIRFKGKTWKKFKNISDLFYLDVGGIKFFLKVQLKSFRITMNEARGYNNEYIESFCNSLIDSLAKRPKICKDCIYRFQYNISRQCEYKYKKSMIKPEE